MENMLDQSSTSDSLGYLKHVENLGIPDTGRKRIILIGGGFGGLTFARHIRKLGFQVVLFDRYNYHTFQPLLYQVATAGLEPDSIAGPLRKMIEGYPDFHFRMLKINAVDTQKKLVTTPLGDISYDILVIANGARTNFFGIKGIHTNSFPLKQIPHALDLRSQIFQCLERAILIEDDIERQAFLNFIVVGGGPTGVEVSGALAELRHHVLPQDYPTIDFHKMNIILVEGKNRLLASMSERASDKSLRYLHELGVDVKLNTTTKDYDGKIVTISSGEKIPCNTVIWAAGVMGNLIQGLPPMCIIRGRIRVNEFNMVIDDQGNSIDDLYSIGDICLMETDDYPNGHPGVAQVAIQMGRNLARNFRRVKLGRNKHPFNYTDKGSLATVGRNKAVADLPIKIKLSGFIGWLIWMTVHLYSIVGFRNKLVVLANWIWNYLRYDKSIRLIIRPVTTDNDPIALELENEKRE
jgi:NADH:ubiquinone reductase (H+-translocating)